MVAPKINSKERQVALCVAAQSGDLTASDELAKSVAAWIRGKAGKYAKRFDLDPDEVEAAGWSRFPAVVRSFNPRLGWSFLNLFATAASRTMLAYCREEAARPRSLGTDVLIDSQPDRPGVDPDLVKAGAAFAGLDPLSREVLRLVSGMDGRPIGFPDVAKRLGMTERRCRALYIVAAGVVRAAVRAA